MCRKCLLVVLLGLLSAPVANGQDTAAVDSGRFFVGSSLFMLGNLSRTNRPDFAQLNVGYRLSASEVVSVEVKTWKYSWPLGIPYGKSFEASAERYPGSIREFGLALAYQRFFWRGGYAAVHAMNSLQVYLDNDQKRIQNGYQLFMTYRTGYQVQLAQKRVFLEPSVAVTQWPVTRNAPEAFAAINRKWPRYFLFEPGLHFGVRF